MKAHKLDLDDLGDINFKKSARARHLNIRIKPYKGVEVSVPRGMSMSAAERFVLQKRDWIVRNLKKVKQFEADSVTYDGTQAIRTRWHRLLGALLDAVLSPVGVDVETEVSVMVERRARTSCFCAATTGPKRNANGWPMACATLTPATC